MTTTNTGDISFVPTCNDVSVSVLHPVLVFLGRVPWCRLSFKEALRVEGKKERETEERERERGEQREKVLNRRT